MSKPCVPAAERNKHAILAVIRPWLAGGGRLLEIGAGTGQHAVHCARALPHLVWQTSDLAGELDAIGAWVREAALPNLPPPCALDVARTPWPAGPWHALYTANTLHYMAWSAVRALFAIAAAALAPDAPMLVYGPFDRAGRHTSAGNASLHAWLVARDPACGLRDRDEVIALAAQVGFALWQDHAMPANNHLLAFRRARSVPGKPPPAQRGDRP